MLAGVAAAAMAGAAYAQPIDLSKGGAVEVTSNNGMEWRQNEQMIIAKGDARAVRGDVTVTADRLIARYRKKAGGPAAVSAVPAPAAPPAPGGTDTNNNEIYRIEAEGNVHIYTNTDQAVGDHAVYDIDQSVMVMTGHAMTITTPQQVMSAHDAMEYWSQKHMAVGRGNAVVTTNDGRRLSGDVLVGYTVDPAADPATQPVVKAAVKPIAKPGGDALGASGKLQRVEAFGNVKVRTATEIVLGDRGVYVPDTGIARIAGNVHLTRGQNQLNGDEAIVNLRTGVSTLTKAPGARVEGLVVPNDATAKSGDPLGGGPALKAKPDKAGK